ncbi:MAG: hypothetical protein ABIH66_09605 [bacterium]
MEKKLPEELIEEINRKQRVEKIEDKIREKNVGKTRKAISIDNKGYKIVAVGNRVHRSDKWRTFPDFLKFHLEQLLGKEWLQSEVQKPLEERHQILKWYDEAAYIQKKLRQNEHGLYSLIPYGAASNLLHLSYDLYVLQHHLSLQDAMIARLKDQNEFQGARHELFAAATCIRAGFDIEYEDETDGKTKHPEFIAVHRETKQRIAIEAKSRHREGLLGKPGEIKTDRLMRGITQLINRAIEKKPGIPYVIFIDINLPVSPEPEQWFKEIRRSLQRSGERKEINKDINNMIIFTNQPNNYPGVKEGTPTIEPLYVISQIPLFPLKNPSILYELKDAAGKYSYIPNSFEEA